MSRPRSLTDATVLDRAIGVFWRHGYADASLRDLTRATGLSAAALYHRFGDKDGLFAASLEHYADEGLTARLADLAADADPLAAISRFFAEIVALSADDPDRLGCFLVNSVLDGGAMSAQARTLAWTRLSEVEAFFRERLAALRLRGGGLEALDPVTMAENLLAIVLAIRVFARLAPDRARLERLADSALAPLRHAALA